MFKPSQIPEVDKALINNTPVYAKDAIGDWIRIDAVNIGGMVRAADHLSGFNSRIVGQWFTPRDIEIQL